MKLLLDENLPRKLVFGLAELFPGTAHVADVNLLQVNDEAIWSFAREKEFCILSKDRDFADRSDVFGHPPKVIWLRVGNCSAPDVSSFLSGARDVIDDFLKDSSKGLLVIPPGVSA